MVPVIGQRSVDIGQRDVGVGLQDAVGCQPLQFVEDEDVLHADAAARNPRLAPAYAGRTFDVGLLRIGSMSLF